MRRIGLGFLAAAVALLVAGCGTPGPILNENVGAIRTGIAAAQQQSQLAFDAANKIAREQAIDAKVKNPELILRQTDFPLPAPPQAAAEWAQAFQILDSYAAALQSLVDPTRSEATGDALQALGQSLNGPNLNARIPASLTGAFSAFGSALVQARAEKKATDVMRSTDAAFNEVVNQMATAIGTSGADAGSLQNSVDSSWNNAVLPLLEQQYRRLDPSDTAGRTRVIESYLTALTARDAQLGSLGQLRQSLLALGEAHSAAAQGRPGDAMFWIKRINGWLDDAKSRTEAVENDQESTP